MADGGNNEVWDLLVNYISNQPDEDDEILALKGRQKMAGMGLSAAALGFNIYQVVQGARMRKEAKRMLNSRPRRPGLPQRNSELATARAKALTEASQSPESVVRAQQEAIGRAQQRIKTNAQIASGGDPNKYAALMQAGLSDLAQQDRSGIVRNEQMRMDRQRRYDDLLGMSMQEDRYLYGEKIDAYKDADGRWRDRYDETRREGNALLNQGVTGIFNNTENIVDAGLDAGYYRRKRKSGRTGAGSRVVDDGLGGVGYGGGYADPYLADEDLAILLNSTRQGD